MIVFAPAYDEQTHACHHYAVRLACAVLLAADEATDKRLSTALLLSDDPLMVMGHGRPDAIVGHNGMVALCTAGLALLKSRSVYAYACYTAAEIAPSYAKSGGRWFGYQGPIQAPPDDPYLSQVFSPLFHWIVKSFVNVRSESEFGSFVTELEHYCSDASRSLDALGERSPASAYICLLHMWQRLRGCITRNGEHLRHPKATDPGYLF